MSQWITSRFPGERSEPGHELQPVHHIWTHCLPPSASSRSRSRPSPDAWPRLACQSQMFLHTASAEGRQACRWAWLGLCPFDKLSPPVVRASWQQCGHPADQGTNTIGEAFFPLPPWRGKAGWGEHRRLTPTGILPRTGEALEKAWHLSFFPFTWRLCPSRGRGHVRALLPQFMPNSMGRRSGGGRPMRLMLRPQGRGGIAKVGRVGLLSNQGPHAGNDRCDFPMRCTAENIRIGSALTSGRPPGPSMIKVRGIVLKDPSSRRCNYASILR